MLNCRSGTEGTPLHGGSGQMGRDQQLAARFQQLKNVASPHLAAACFAWGVAQAETLTTHRQGQPSTASDWIEDAA